MAFITSITKDDQVYPKAYIKLQHYEQVQSGVMAEFVVFANYDDRVELTQPLIVVNLVCPNMTLTDDDNDAVRLYEEFKNLNEDLVFEPA
jgi:hypothetical protein